MLANWEENCAMSNKTLTGTYSAGYTLSPAYDMLSISPTGRVWGAGGGGVGVSLVASGAVDNYGTITGGAGDYGFYAQPNGGPGVAFAAGGGLDNHGAILGGAGNYGRNGGAGGVGVLFSAGGVVHNYGAISGAAAGYHTFNVGHGGVGISFASDGTVDNYGAITGGAGGYGPLASHGDGGAGIVFSTGGTVSNHGTIAGGAGGYSYGNSSTSSAGGAGGAGIRLSAPALVENYGAIIGAAGGVCNYRYGITAGGAGGAGVWLLAGGVVANRGVITGGRGGASSSGSRGADGMGIYAGAGGVATVDNFGTIAGGIAVQFNNAGDRLIAEAGSTFIGEVQGDGGTLELAGGSGTITGLGGVGAASGSVAIEFSGFGAYAIDAGAAWTLSGNNTAASLTVAGTLTVADKATLAVQGGVVNSGQIVVAASGHTTSLLVGKTGATLSGGGTVTLGGNAFDRIIGATTVATLSNFDNTIAGSGQLGSGKMILVNEVAGVIEQTGASLTIDTGVRRIVNDGTFEATGLGGLTIAGAVLNRGMIETKGGNLTVDGAVAGGGSAVINGGVLTFVNAFSQNVYFSGSIGELALGGSQGYHGKITGFSKTGGTSMDLRDIGFVSAFEASFSGTKNGGVLTVTDGAHTAHISLAGNYTGSTWACSSDGGGGVVVTDSQSANLPRIASSSAFVAIMAGLGANGASAPVATAHLDTWRPTLMAPKAQLN